MNPTVKKVIRIISLIIAGAILGAIGFLCWKISIDKEAFKVWMDELGFLGYVVFVIMVILQIIVAIVPGGPIEMAGGYAFGTFLGTSLFLIGATIGSIIVFLLVRKFGKPAVELFFKEKDIHKLDFLKDDKKRSILFLVLFIIPGSPKDLLCYVAGLTDMKFWFFILIASLGRLPAVIGSAISGEAIGGSNYTIAVVALAIILGLSGIGLLIYLYILKKKGR